MKDAPARGERAGAQGDGDLLNTATLPDPAAAAKPNPLIDAARRYLARGLVPIRLGNLSKVPLGKHEANTVTADTVTANTVTANTVTATFPAYLQ